MNYYDAKMEFIRAKEIFKGEQEWEKAFALFHCLTIRDRETAEHSIEVGYFAARIAERLNLDSSRYFLGGMLHDIGKICMGDHPLKTSVILTKKDREKLKEHVLHGVLTLSELGFKNDIIQFCLRHHERLNGSGYPFGVGREDISIEGRIAQISDVFSALTSPRKYRDGKNVYSYEEALKIMKLDTNDSGAFDSDILTILEEIVTLDKMKKRQHA